MKEKMDTTLQEENYQQVSKGILRQQKLINSIHETIMFPEKLSRDERSEEISRQSCLQED